jgi:hypothetical protein
MATLTQKVEARRGGQPRTSELITLTMAAGAVVDQPIAIPQGSAALSFRWMTPAAFTGSPTNIWLTVGKTSGGQDYVANTDAKAAAGLSAPTQATGAVADLVAWPAQSAHATLTANGGTNAAGTVYLLVEYTPPPA